MATKGYDENSIKKVINSSSNDEIRTIKKKSSFIFPFLLMLPAVILFVLYTLIPLIKVIFDSFKDGSDHGLYASYYAQIWTDGDWYLSVFNSFVYAIISVPAEIIISLIISFAISNVIRKKYREFWQTIFFLPYVTSAIAISIVFSIMFSSEEYGIINWLFGIHKPWLTSSFDRGPIAFIPLLAFGIWHSLAFKILILTSTMLAIDKRLYDAAAIDGASKKQMFFNVTLPSINGTIWYLITVGLIASLKVFPLALFGNSVNTAMENMPTMLMYVYQFAGGSAKNIGKAGAASVSLIFVVLIFNYVIRKFMFMLEYKFSGANSVKEIEEIKKFKLIKKANENYDLEKSTENIASFTNNVKRGDK